ncbi:hypothetical protein RKE38_16305 [Phycicoccus sp. M110.8]|uniref:hypothetical protein n=1 Tax=Phycicoccus sp. M110.8 TaxID=3075433 RepID=UPI0028FD0EC5|nr:hypothetical protein [Phycicoccus sp. M110.8]MDU0315263.1 hypothetical protein [Phycicoccus sp. M110.8]
MSAMTVDGPRPAVEWVTSMPYRLTDAEFRVLMLLALDSYDGVTAAPGYDNLARWSGLLRSSVGAALARLCEPAEHRPALVRRVGKRQRHTVFAFSRPALPDISTGPATPEEWVNVSSGRAGQVVSSGRAGRDGGDTPVDPSGQTRRTLPSTTRVPTSTAQVTRTLQESQRVPQSDGGEVQGGHDESGVPSAGTSPDAVGRFMSIYSPPGERYGFVRLTSDDGRQWFRDRGIHSMYSRLHRAHEVRREHLADIATIAELEGWHIREYTKKPTK